MRNAISGILAALVVIALVACGVRGKSNTELMLSNKPDISRDRLWWLTSEGVLVHRVAAASQRLSLPGWIWAWSPRCPPDIALGPNGEAVVTSNVISTLWRVDAQTLAVSVHELVLDSDEGKDVGFTNLAYSAEQAAFFAYSDDQRSVWKIDPQLTRATKVAAVDLGRLHDRRLPSPYGACADLGRRLDDFIRVGGQEG